MRVQLLEYVLWLSAPVLQAAVLYFMYRRQLHKEYPYFFNYTILQILTVAFLAVVRPISYTTYYFGYWVTISLSILLSFAVLQEIFTDAFRPFEALRDLSVILFRWSALVVLLVAGMSAISSVHTNQVDAITSTIFLVERNVRVMQCGLVFFLLLFSEYLGISRRHILFGIALGFGFFAAISMLVVTAIPHTTIIKRSTLNELNSGAYVISCLIWLGFTASRKSVRTALSASEARSRDWNIALEDVRAPLPPESILDSMDRTVEQLLYHREARKSTPAAVK